MMYYAEGGNLTWLKNRFTQDGKSFEFDVCGDSGYMHSFSDELRKGMVLTLSLWGGSWNDMSWLDDMTGCWGDCTPGNVSFGNIVVQGT